MDTPGGGRPPSERDTLPRADITRTRWRGAVIWIVPLVAALIAGYLIVDRWRSLGPEITIRFRDGGGIRVGQTPIHYRGVQIGEVTDVRLSEDHQRVEVRARLQRSAAAIARDGAVFWIARPEVGIGNITGLATVITGPEIQALPGDGESQSEFTGLESPPPALETNGLRIVLRAGKLGSLQRNSPVYYRGVEVGVVQEATLSADATAAQITVLIRQRYAPLVRGNSVFWNVSGARVSGGIFRGVELQLESLRSLAAGGINLATPNDNAPPAKNGAVFPLHADGRGEWQAWAPRIPLPREDDAPVVPEAAPDASPAPAPVKSPAKARKPPPPRSPGAHP